MANHHSYFDKRMGDPWIPDIRSFKPIPSGNFPPNVS